MKYFDLDIRIRYSETDQMGICYYSNYFIWYEMARTEYFRSLGFPYVRYEAEGIFLPVGEAYCRYYKPLRYDDLIIVKTWITALKRTSIKFAYRITKKGECESVAEGKTTHIFVDRNMKPCPIPPEIREKVEIVTS